MCQLKDELREIALRIPLLLFSTICRQQTEKQIVQNKQNRNFFLLNETLVLWKVIFLVGVNADRKNAIMRLSNI